MIKKVADRSPTTMRFQYSLHFNLQAMKLIWILFVCTSGLKAQMITEKIPLGKYIMQLSKLNNFVFSSVSTFEQFIFFFSFSDYYELYV